MRLPLSALLCWLALTLPAQGHPSHTSFAEIGWSEDGGSLEVSLRVIPEDLESELGLRQGSPVMLQDTPEHRAMVVAWLRDAFVISAAGQPLRQQLAGLELGYDQTWIYFSVSADRRQELALAYTVLIEYNRERGRNQVNQARRLWGPANDRMTYTTAKRQLLWSPE